MTPAEAQTQAVDFMARKLGLKEIIVLPKHIIIAAATTAITLAEHGQIELARAELRQAIERTNP